MARRNDNVQARLDRDLAELKLPEIAKSYREVLDDAARKGSSVLEVLATLFGMEPGPARTLSSLGNLGTCALSGLFVYHSL
jgi:hypothetical protein